MDGGAVGAPAPAPKATPAEPAPRPRHPGGRPIGSRTRPRPDAAQAARAAEDARQARQDQPADDKPKRRKHTPKPEQVEANAKQIFGVHQVLAGMFAIPELALTREECVALSEQALETSAAFGIDELLESKWFSLVAFVGTLGMVYFPRFNMLRERLAREQAQRDAARTVDGVVVDGPAPQPVQAAPEGPGDGIAAAA